jgi:hypothetical protein
VIATPYVGNADLVRAIDPEFVVEPQPAAVAATIDRALDQDLTERGERARAIGRGFTAERQLAAFEARFNEIITLLDGAGV